MAAKLCTAIRAGAVTAALVVALDAAGRAQAAQPPNTGEPEPAFLSTSNRLPSSDDGHIPPTATFRRPPCGQGHGSRDLGCIPKTDVMASLRSIDPEAA